MPRVAQARARGFQKDLQRDRGRIAPGAMAQSRGAVRSSWSGAVGLEPTPTARARGPSSASPSPFEPLPTPDLGRLRAARLGLGAAQAFSPEATSFDLERFGDAGESSLRSPQRTLRRTWSPRTRSRSRAVSHPKRISGQEPGFPEAARLARFQGMVSVPIRREIPEGGPTRLLKVDDVQLDECTSDPRERARDRPRVAVPPGDSERQAGRRSPTADVSFAWKLAGRPVCEKLAVARVRRCVDARPRLELTTEMPGSPQWFTVDRRVPLQSSTIAGFRSRRPD